jgi:hypothetical protein
MGRVTIEWMDGEIQLFEGVCSLSGSGTFIQLVRLTSTGQEPGDCIPLANLRRWRIEPM